MKKFLFVFCIAMALILTACSSGGSSTSTSSSSSDNSSNAGDSDSKNSDEKYVLRVSHPYPEISAQQKTLEWYNDELVKRSDGRLSLDIFPGAQLMPPDQEIPGILNGQIDIALPLSSLLGSLDSVWYLFELPYLFDFDPEEPNVYLEHKRAFLHSEKGGELIKSLTEKHGLKVLHMSQDNYSEVFTSGKDNMITDLESFKGKKIRTTGGTIQGETFEALGASPMVVAAPEVAPAMQQGLVDGVISSANYAAQHYPVKTWTAIPLNAYVLTITMSVEKFNSLPKDLQDILAKTGKDLDLHQDEVSNKMITEDLKKMVKEKGIESYFPTEKEHNEIKKVLLPAHKKWADTVEVGHPLLEEIENTKIRK
jgi:C4-dicarboxylate-binding protein DctP